MKRHRVIVEAFNHKVIINEVPIFTKEAANDDTTPTLATTIVSLATTAEQLCLTNTGTGSISLPVNPAEQDLTVTIVDQLSDLPSKKTKMADSRDPRSYNEPETH